MKSGLKTADLARLRKALERLPIDLAYLAKPIMEAAANDPEAISVGAAEVPSFDVIWQKRAEEMGTDAAMQQAGEHAALLGVWLRSFDNPNASWLGPAWAIEGMLHGCVMYGLPDEEHAAAEAFEKQYQQGDSRFSRISLDVPEGMKSRNSQQGWELQDKNVKIMIAEIPAEAFEMLSMQLAALDQTELPSEAECEQDFEVGDAFGFKAVRQLPAGGGSMATYLLTVPGGHVQVSLTARSPGRKLDLAKYEEMFGSIRCD